MPTATVTIEEVKNYIMNLPPIDSTTLNYMESFIQSQKVALSKPCHDSKAVDTDLIVKASDSLKRHWGHDVYNELVSMILELKPHEHAFFKREIMKFILVTMYYGLFRSEQIMFKSALLFGLYSFSYNFTLFFKYCDPELMVMAIQNSHNKSLYKKYKDFVSVVEYIVLDNFKSYDPKNRVNREPWVLFRLIININNRIKLSLKNLANTYHSLSKEVIDKDEREYTDNLVSAGIDINAIVASIKSAMQLLVSHNPDEFSHVEKVTRIKKEIVMDIYNYWIEFKFDSIIKIITILLNHSVKHVKVSNEKELCSKLNEITKECIYLITTKSTELQNYKTIILKFIDETFEELSYHSLKNRMLKEKAALIVLFMVRAIAISVCSQRTM